MRNGWVGALLMLLIAAVSAEAKTIRVATINAANYLETDRMVEGVYRHRYPKPESEKRLLRGLLKAVDADIVALQEIGPEPFLIELQRDLEREGLYYPERVWMKGADDERHLAILARTNIVDVRRHDDLDFTYFGERAVVRRGLLEVVVEHEGARWVLFNLHLKSRFTERADDPEALELRVKEAEAIRNLVRIRLREKSGVPLLVVGDFNDTTSSRTLSRFLEVNDESLLRLVPCVDSRGETWTHYFRKEDIYSRADYVLASPEMFSWIVGGKGRIVDDPRWRDASDHRLVWVEVGLPE